jgi:two-component system, LuxR family, sensor kinase FixL
MADIRANRGMKKNKKQPVPPPVAPPAIAVRDQAERLRAILETAVESIITIDDHGLIESFNPAAEKLFGYPAAEVIGHNVSLLMPAPHREKHDSYIRNYQQTGQAKIIGIGRETQARKKDGTIFPIDLSVSEVKLSDRRLFTGIIRDISDRKRLEKEILEISEREQRRIGQDLHDGLCQQLAGIEMLSQVLAHKLAPRSKNSAARAEEIAGAVRDSISQTRRLARGLSPATLESEGLPAALTELALNTARMFQVKCTLSGEQDLSSLDHATATHLFRIAQESVSNAIKHGRAKDIRLTLQREAGKLHLTIQDDGQGFPAKLKKNPGMGLRIMQSRINMIGGTLLIEKNPGRGVTVFCHLPLA